MKSALTEDEFIELFSSFTRTARRLESRNRYDVEEERVGREAFLAGERPSVRPVRSSPWDLNLQAKTAEGAKFERVRIMDEPLTPYNRFMIWSNAQNQRNGEDIRYLTRSRANLLQLPEHDFWVFDSTLLLLMPFTHDDRILETAIVTDPDLVARHEAWIDVAMANATRWVDYVAEDPSRTEPPIRLAPEVTTGGL